MPNTLVPATGEAMPFAATMAHLAELLSTSNAAAVEIITAPRFIGSAEASMRWRDRLVASSKKGN